MKRICIGCSALLGELDILDASVPPFCPPCARLWRNVDAEREGAIVRQREALLAQLQHELERHLPPFVD